MVLLTSTTLFDSSAYLSDNVSRGTLHTTEAKIQYCLNFVSIRELPEHQDYLEKEDEVDKM